MKTRSSRRLPAAVAVMAAILLSGALAPAEAATSGRAVRQGRQAAAHGAAPSAATAVGRWVTRLLADIGLAPNAPTPPATGGVSSTTQTASSDNGALIDPNG